MFYRYAKTRLMQRSNLPARRPSFDHLIGASQERRWVQPSCFSASRNAERRSCPSRSLASKCISTPIRWTLSCGCARAANGQMTLILVTPMSSRRRISRPSPTSESWQESSFRRGVLHRVAAHPRFNGSLGRRGTNCRTVVARVQAPTLDPDPPSVSWPSGVAMRICTELTTASLRSEVGNSRDFRRQNRQDVSAIITSMTARSAKVHVSPRTKATRRPPHPKRGKANEYATRSNLSCVAEAGDGSSARELCLYVAAEPGLLKT